MTIKISDTEMTSDVTRHTATHTGGGWTVTWLPGRTLTQSEAITAMTVAEMVVERAHILANPSSRLWWHMDGWAAELGLTGPHAVTEASLNPEDRESLDAAEAAGDGAWATPNFVLYHRAAVADQRDAKPSQDAQLHHCLAYIEAKGWANVAEYVEDAQGDAE
jgi:hypothetical protein